MEAIRCTSNIDTMNEQANPNRTVYSSSGDSSFLLSIVSPQTYFSCPSSSAAPADILLLTPHNAKSSLIQYRLVGGTLDFYIFAGPTPIDVAEQYAQVVGLPTLQPAWGFGFQLCRYVQRLDSDILECHVLRIQGGVIKI
jgi:alpha-glucosidase (family GH31 glycosyl hydrolase)